MKRKLKFKTNWPIGTEKGSLPNKLDETEWRSMLTSTLQHYTNCLTDWLTLRCSVISVKTFRHLLRCPFQYCILTVPITPLLWVRRFHRQGELIFPSPCFASTSFILRIYELFSYPNSSCWYNVSTTAFEISHLTRFKAPCVGAFPATPISPLAAMY